MIFHTVTRRTGILPVGRCQDAESLGLSHNGQCTYEGVLMCTVCHVDSVTSPSARQDCPAIFFHGLSLLCIVVAPLIYLREPVMPLYHPQYSYIVSMARE